MWTMHGKKDLAVFARNTSSWILYCNSGTLTLLEAVATIQSCLTKAYQRLLYVMQFFKHRRECLASEKSVWPLSTKFSPLIPATFCVILSILQWHSQRSLPYGLLPLHTTISIPCLLWYKQGTINYYTM